MKLQEKHKEFAVKCFARFMTRTEVVDVTPQDAKALKEARKSVTD